MKMIGTLLNAMARRTPEIDCDSPNVQTETRGGANPFTVAHDGWMCGWFNNVSAAGSGVYVRVNGIEVAAISSLVNVVDTCSVGVPVKQGDSVDIRVVGASQQYSLKIIPYLGGVVSRLLDLLAPERGWAL